MAPSCSIRYLGITARLCRGIELVESCSELCRIFRRLCGVHLEVKSGVGREEDRERYIVVFSILEAINTMLGLAGFRRQQ